MKTFSSSSSYLFFLSITLLLACQEDILQEEDCSLQGNLNSEVWCGQVFEIFEDEAGNLVVNAEKASKKENVGVEQLTFSIPDFKGTGTYLIAPEGAMYREWLTDLLLECALSAGKNTDKVIVESFDAGTGQISGKVTFSVETHSQSYLFEEGYFRGTIR